MLLRHLPLGLLLAIASYAQDTTTSSGSSSLTVLSGGLTEATLPTGPYITYSSTITLTTTSSSAITTEALISTITSGSSTITSTLGSTTIFSVSIGIANGNITESTSTHSQILLSGSGRSTPSAGNGTSNATSTSAPAQATNVQPCNNYPEFCERKYGNITEVSAHNSPFVNAGSAAANQALSVTTQLNDGIRMLQAQAHFVNGIPHFCHTSCDVLDAGPITTYLGEVHTWVSNHPYDVVTILIGNGNYTPVSEYVPFIESTGLIQYAYVPPKIPMGINDWPTLASMILTGKRVVFFMDYDANQTAYPWLMDEFSQMWETPFDPTDRSFPCTVERPPALPSAEAKNRLYMINHNLNFDINILGNSLLVPNIPLLNVTNDATGEGSLGASALNCTEEWNNPPKFLNVDYYNVGNGSVFEVQAKMNNVTYTRNCCGFATSSGMRLGAEGPGIWIAIALGLWIFF
jgi:hypothetical protein